MTEKQKQESQQQKQQREARRLATLSKNKNIRRDAMNSGDHPIRQERA